LGKRYSDVITGKHILDGTEKELVGTLRFMPRRAHKRLTMSRRDDFEALGYVFVYFLSEGKLEWQELNF